MTNIARLDDITEGMRLEGAHPTGPVLVEKAERQGQTVSLIFRKTDGTLEDRLITLDDLKKFKSVAARRFTADPELFRLVSEAERIQNSGTAALSETSGAVSLLPHQIETVNGRLLKGGRTSFLLADDPGSGKTVMSGMFIKGLMSQGTLRRCLVVAPGSLVGQWQQEMKEKFGLGFGMFETGRSDDLLIARMDQVARNEKLFEELGGMEWDLVVVDEAHKMSAHWYGDVLEKTKRFRLGEMLRSRTRNLLLLTATPHNGKEDDFRAFMTLLDPDRFVGRQRNPEGAVPDLSDVMTRRVKENLKTLDGRSLFPGRSAETLAYDLSSAEQSLYENVTAYVREGMNRAERIRNPSKSFIVSFALMNLQRRMASSPQAAFRSLRRRRLRLLNRGDERSGVSDLFPRGWDDFDFDELEEGEVAVWEERGVVLADVGAAELEEEVRWLVRLEEEARELRNSREDSKWRQLAEFLGSSVFEGSPPPRLIVFTEHRDTLDYLEGRLVTRLGRGEAVVTVHGGKSWGQRGEAIRRFWKDPGVRVLVATDAAGEGVNLHCAHLMVNYDLPWNPNRLEQRFGRIHRIGQRRECRVWNLLSHSTREGRVFERLLEKLETQRRELGGEIYDVLGDASLNRSFRQIFEDAVRDDVVGRQQVDEVCSVFGDDVARVMLAKRNVLPCEDVSAGFLRKVRGEVSAAAAERLSPAFTEAFVVEALGRLGGRIVGRSGGLYEITRVPSRLRADYRGVKERYERVSFGGGDGGGGGGAGEGFCGCGCGGRCDGSGVGGGGGGGGGGGVVEVLDGTHPLMSALTTEVLGEHGSLLREGTVMLDETDLSVSPRVMARLHYRVTNSLGDEVSSGVRLVSMRLGGKPRVSANVSFLNYRDLLPSERVLVDDRMLEEASGAADFVTKWAGEGLAAKMFEETATLEGERIRRLRSDIRQRLGEEIGYWENQVAVRKEKELVGKRLKETSGQARRRVDDLRTRLERREDLLGLEADLVNSPPVMTAVVLLIPQGMLNRLKGTASDVLRAETDMRAVAAVMAAERRLGREPEEMDHVNEGFDVRSRAADGTWVFIEVKGHRPSTADIKVSAAQVRYGKQLGQNFRLAVVEVPLEAEADPVVNYVVNPFFDDVVGFAETSRVYKVSRLAERFVEPV